MTFYLCVSQVFQLLTDLKEQRKDSGKHKHSVGQQNLNTIMYEVSLRPLDALVCPLISYLHFQRYDHSLVLVCISTQTMKYLSKTPCSRQSPEIVKEFLTTMMPHKLTKSVRSDCHITCHPLCFQEDFIYCMRHTAPFR